MITATILNVKPPIPNEIAGDMGGSMADVASYAAASNNPHVAAATVEVWH